MKRLLVTLATILVTASAAAHTLEQTTDGEGVIFSTATTQYVAGTGTVFHQHAYRMDPDTMSIDPIARFLPSTTSLDALDVDTSGGLLFSVRPNSVVVVGGVRSTLLETSIYRYDGTGVQLVLDPVELGLNLGTLNAIDDLDDGSYAISVSRSRYVQSNGTLLHVRPWQVWRLVREGPGAASLQLIRDFASFRIRDIDGVDVLPDGRIAITSATTVFTGTSAPRRIWKQNIYLYDPADGSMQLEFDGNRHRLRDLDALTLDPREGDDLPPTIVAAASPAPNAAGWNNTDVTVTFACSDAESGIASCPDPVPVTDEGAGQQVSGTAVDQAGNEATASITIHLDKTPPTVQIDSHADGSSVGDPVIVVAGTLHDALAGVTGATCAGVAVAIDGERFSGELTLLDGSNVVSCEATDAAGNVGSTEIEIVVTLNRPPRLHVEPAWVVEEGELLAFTVSAVDPDGDPLQLSAADSPDGASFLASVGHFHWRPGTTQSGDYDVTFTASDGALEDQATVRIEVLDVNLPPVIRAVEDRTVHAGDTLALEVRAADPDGDGLVLSAERISGELEFTFVDLQYGRGAFDALPSETSLGVSVIRFTASDGEFDVTESFDVTVVSRTERPDPWIDGEPLTLVSLEVVPGIVLLSEGERAQVMVIGTFSDGSTSDLTASASGTTYEPDDALVADVSAEGEILGLGVGTTPVAADNQGITARGLVTVRDPGACSTWAFDPPSRFPEPLAGPFPDDAVQGGQVIAWGDFNEDGWPDPIIGIHAAPYNHVDLFLGDGRTWEFASHLYLVRPRGLGISSVVVADFNGDGHDDIAGSRAAYDSIVIQFGRGDGTFGSYTYNPATGPDHLATADFDGNGSPDLAGATDYGSFDKVVSVLLNEGDGSFGAPSTAILTGTRNHWLSTGDFDGDDRIDLIWSKDLSSAPYSDLDAVELALGLGDGSFTDPIDLLTVENPETRGLMVDDLDGDGRTDLITLTLMYPVPDPASGPPVHRLDAYREYGAGLFARSARIEPTVGGFFSPVLSDLSGDDIPDLALGVRLRTPAYSSALLLMEGQGDGTFEEIAVIANDPGYRSLAPTTADVDGDGRLDLIVGGQYGYAEGVIYGSACPSRFDLPEHSHFQFETTDDGLHRGFPAIGDVDGDGLNDVVYVATGTYSPLLRPVVALLRREATGGFTPTPPQVLDDPQVVRDLVLADFDADGRQDVAILGERGGGIALYRWNGSSGLEPAGQLSLTGFTRSAAVGDFDGNGYPDIFFRFTSTLSSLRYEQYQFIWNSGAWSFTAGPVELLPEDPVGFRKIESRRPEVVDLNLDGLDDLVSQREGAIALSRGAGALSWIELSGDYGIESQINGIWAVGDFAEDGFVDIVTNARLGATLPYEYIDVFCRNLGDETFDCDTQLEIRRGNARGVVRDFDGDGNLDFTIGATDGGSHWFYFGDGAGDFPRLGWRHGIVTGAYLAGDFDGNGTPDVLKFSSAGSSESEPTDGIYVTVMFNRGVASAPDTILGLRAGPRSTLLTEPGASVALSVVGVRADGSTTDLTPDATGTTYTVSDPAVVAVDENGVVSALSSGRALITIDSAGLTARVAMLVILADELIELRLTTPSLDMSGIEMSVDTMVEILEAVLTNDWYESAFADPPLEWDRALVESHLQAVLGDRFGDPLFGTQELFGLLQGTVSTLVNELIFATGRCAGGDACRDVLVVGEFYLEQELAFWRRIDLDVEDSAIEQLLVEAVFANGFTIIVSRIPALGVGFSIADPSVATVDATGRTLALNGGSTAFTVEWAGLSADGTITVTTRMNVIDGNAELVAIDSPATVGADALQLPLRAQVTSSQDAGGILVSFTLEIADRKPYAATGVTGTDGWASVLLPGRFPIGAGLIAAELRNPGTGRWAGAVLSRIEQPIVIEPGPAFSIVIWTEPRLPMVGDTATIRTRVADIAGNGRADALALSTDAPDAVMDFTVTPPTIVFPTPGLFELTATVGGISTATNVAVRQTEADIALARISPTSGAAGSQVHLKGAGFSEIGSANLVRFNGVLAAEPLAFNGTDLYVSVPAGAGSGPVTVEVSGATSNGLPFERNDALARRPVSSDDVAAGFKLGEALVTYRNEMPDTATLSAVNAAYGLVGQIGYPSTGSHVALVPDGATAAETRDLVAALNADPRVLLAVRNRVTKPKATPPPITDTRVDRQNFLHLSNLFLGLNTRFPRRGDGVTIAVIDGGISDTVADLELDATPRWAYLEKKLTPESAAIFDAHGSIVATIAAAAINGQRGIGVAPEAKLLSVRVFPDSDDEAGSDDLDLIGAIEFAAGTYGAEVINLSQGADYEDTAEGQNEYQDEKANYCKELAKAMTPLPVQPVIVVAAGNERNEDNQLPWAGGMDCVSPPTIVVGALDIAPVKDLNYGSLWTLEQDSFPKMAPYSNFGPGSEIDFVAAGDVATTTIDGSFVYVGGGGTSFATPQVAGLAALIVAEKKAAAEAWNPEGIRTEMIKKYTLDLDDPELYCAPADLTCKAHVRAGYDEMSGHGMLYIFELFATGGVAMPPALNWTPAGANWTLSPPEGEPVVVKIGPTWKPITIATGPPLVNPVDLELTADGDLLVVDAGWPRELANVEDGAVYRIRETADGSETTLLAGNATAIAVKPTCIQLDPMTWCRYAPPFPDPALFHQTHGMIDPYNLAIDEHGDLRVLDGRTNVTNGAAWSVHFTRASLFHVTGLEGFGGKPPGWIKEAGPLRLPPRPWAQPPGTMSYDWPDNGGDLPGPPFGITWMTYSRTWKEQTGLSGLIVSHTPGWDCLDPDDVSCVRPSLNGAILAEMNPWEPLELLKHGEATHPWQMTWVPVADSDGRVLFGAEHENANDSYYRLAPDGTLEPLPGIDQAVGAPAMSWRDLLVIKTGADRMIFATPYDGQDIPYGLVESELRQLHSIAILGRPN